MTRSIGFIAVCAALLAVMPVAAQDNGPTAAEVMARIDDAVNGARDQSCTMAIVLTDKGGAQKTRQLQMLQKGRDKRLARFLAPADQRGISFLSLPDDVQYLYLPAFGKVRRIASHVKNTSFAGTDFTYEDMEAVRMADRWQARIQKVEEGVIVLELTLRPGQTSQYSRLLVWVRADIFYPVKMEQYDKSGKLLKELTREKLQQIQGYWVSMETTMRDVQKQHVTTMTVSQVTLDTGLPDSAFTERALSQ
jgi:outer membrane lipoprotein-sorting protein